ncbi:Glycerophosphodiester phosphodiesterase [Paenibacillus plantiphilus]|uniref:Glycerophosphodiester phosphodiesterase n=1 Tax=Paenibacillus plantiphilus TaxID=2905650 RepID=A0ABM9CUC3_9BACL|nr:glycerophosphodiester phosphodiesterase family protein [Paenibacillus plantiphilus]CAH1222603.1 Glycerophosphodiester phosphodiesterase [Paenibacillus plantiphilus]
MNNPCAAHRGASGLAPENTLAAVREALAFPFVQWIELDVQLSSDGIPVVIHDDRVNRTTNAAGRVVDYTAAQMYAFDAGSWFDKQFAGEGVPTLEQVIEAAKGRCRLNIELKTYSGLYPMLEQRVVELVYEHGLQHDAVITSFDTGALRRVRQLSEEIETGLIVDKMSPHKALDELRQLEAGFLSLGYRSVSSKLMELMREAGITVMAWTVDDIADMQRLAAIDPTIVICTNYPDRYGQLLAKQQ